MATEEMPNILAKFLSLGMSIANSIGIGITRGLPGAFKQINERVPRLTRQFLTGLRNLTREATTILPDALREFRTGFPQMIEGVVQQIQEKGPEIIENMGTLLDGVFNLENYEIVWEGVSSVVGSLAEAFDTANVSWDEVGQKIGEGIKFVATDILPSLLEGATEFFDVAEDIIHGIATELEGLDYGEDGELATALQTYIPLALNSIGDIAGDLTTIAGNIVKAIGSAIGMDTSGIESLKVGLTDIFKGIGEQDF